LDRIDNAPRETIANRPRILEWAPPEVMIRAAVCHARLDLLQESADVALAFLTSYRAYYQGLALDRPEAYMLAEQVKILVDTGKRKRANEIAAQLRELGQRHRNAGGFWAEINPVAESALARVLIAESRAEDALKSLQVVRDYAERFGRRRLLVRTDLQSAMASAGMKRTQDAAEFASRAMRLGFRSGLVRTFLDEGRGAGELLLTLRNTLEERLDEAEAAYLGTLLDRFALSQPHQRKTSQVSADHDPINLTPREIEILALICRAMPNKRIALALNITLETVKWNVKNILAKLGVSNRYDAISRARESGLVK
jgi:LuxR family maltose regulon positive regulatory protein